jgi:hypothetical protein
MSDIPITDLHMHDGSRHFLSLPESILPCALVERMRANPEFQMTGFLEGALEAWIDFEFQGHKFSVNNQFGEFWFFVADAACPVDLLTEIQRRFAGFLVE